MAEVAALEACVVGRYGEYLRLGRGAGIRRAGTTINEYLSASDSDLTAARRLYRAAAEESCWSKTLARQEIASTS
jgi:hypothetical protein